MPQSEFLTRAARTLFAPDSIANEKVSDLNLWMLYLKLLNTGETHLRSNPWMGILIDGRISEVVADGRNPVTLDWEGRGVFGLVPGEEEVLEEFVRLLNLHILTNLTPPGTKRKLARVIYVDDMREICLDWRAGFLEFMKNPSFSEQTAKGSLIFRLNFINREIPHYAWALTYPNYHSTYTGLRGPDSLPYVRNSKTFENLLTQITREPDGNFEKLVVSEFWMPWAACKGWSAADVALYLKLLDFSTVGRTKSLNFPQGGI